MAERELERLLLEQEKARDPFAVTGMKEQSAKKKKKGKKQKKKEKAKKVVKADDDDEESSSSGEEDGDDEAEHAAPGQEVEPDVHSHEEETPADNLALALVSDDSAAAAAAAAIVTEQTGTGRVWTEAYDGEGTPYYYNEEGETVWELPEGDTAVPEEHHPGGLEGDESGGGAEYAWEAGAAERGHGDASAWGTEDNGGESAWEAEEGGGLNGGDDEWVEGGGSSWGEEWEEAHDDQGVAYWYNAGTGESVYE